MCFETNRFTTVIPAALPPSWRRRFTFPIQSHYVLVLGQKINALTCTDKHDFMGFSFHNGATTGQFSVK
jgi:hypothetical protein